MQYAKFPYFHLLLPSFFPKHPESQEIHREKDAIGIMEKITQSALKRVKTVIWWRHQTIIGAAHHDGFSRLKRYDKCKLDTDLKASYCS